MSLNGYTHIIEKHSLSLNLNMVKEKGWLEMHLVPLVFVVYSIYIYIDSYHLFIYSYNLTAAATQGTMKQSMQLSNQLTI